jgi:hypothetical protein
MKFVKLLVLSLLFYSCSYLGAGGLGVWNIHVFKISEKELIKAVDSFYKVNPEFYHIKKWKPEAEYWVRNYSDLKTVIFYFEESPEEMYYVTFVSAGTGDNPNYSRLAIRGVENGKGNWKQYDEFNTIEQERIETRFEKEIIFKLEKITKTTSYVVETYH